MKKAILFPLALIISLLILFISCNDNEFAVCKITVSCSNGGNVSITKYIGTTANVPVGNIIEVVANPNDGYEFTGWFIGNNDKPVSKDASFTFIASEDIALLAKFTPCNDNDDANADNENNGNDGDKDDNVDNSDKDNLVCNGEAIDLGLPSGIKWASFNVGATQPEEIGDYFAWGETEKKDDYSWSTYKYCNIIDNEEEEVEMTKYCTDSEDGEVDNKTVLAPEDDVAHVQWGGKWRMPTTQEMDELFEICEWEAITYKGILGYKVTGPNGNSIFFPATGYQEGTMDDQRGENGYYWTSSLSSYDSSEACTIDLYIGDIDDYGYGHNSYSRCNGHTVRPVCE